MAQRSLVSRLAMASFRGRFVLLAGLFGAVALVFILRSQEPGTSIVAHPHGLVVNPADGLVYIGTHEGLYQVEVGGRRIVRVGGVAHDLMSLTAGGPDHFFASGHPAAVTRELPANLGLIETRDAGKSWQPVSLSGQVDLHAMRLSEGRLYAYGEGTLAMSADQGQDWTLITSGEFEDFVVTAAGSLIATTRSGLMRGPATPGTRLSPQAGPPVLRLSIGPDASIWGATAGGDIFRSADDGVQWERRGKVSGQPGALLASTDGVYIAPSDGSLFRSTDGGATWSRIGA